jgi:hypothetical protein
VTAPLATVGLATPAAWLVPARAAGLLALGLLYRLTARRAGPLVGVAAAGGLAATPAWWTTLLGGGIEPVTVEALILVVAYGAVLTREDRPGRWAALTVAACALVLATWLGGDWLGSGDPLRGVDRHRPHAARARLPAARALPDPGRGARRRAGRRRDRHAGPGPADARPAPVGVFYFRSNRSRFMTLTHAATKSLTNFSPASSLA